MPRVIRNRISIIYMRKDNILVTGGSGFLGSFVVDLLIKKGCNIVIFDRLLHHAAKKMEHALYTKGDILHVQDVADVFRQYGPFKTVYHLAAAMPNKALSDEETIRTNVQGTANVAALAAKNKTTSFVFTSSNVTYGIPEKLPVTEETTPHPLEAYGKSKLEAEEVLRQYKKEMNIQIFRCPVITGEGRLGLQSILYEFISEHKNVYLLGSGSNIYQFADAGDVAAALVKASHMRGFDIYNIGGDGYMELRKMYEKIIEYAGSHSKIVVLPSWPAELVLKILDTLNISPLGPYQYTMIGRSLYADTKKIKTKLSWIPEKSNLESFIENYQWYLDNKHSFKELGSSELSANRSLPKMGIFKLLKALS